MRDLPGRGDPEHYLIDTLPSIQCHFIGQSMPPISPKTLEGQFRRLTTGQRLSQAICSIGRGAGLIAAIAHPRAPAPVSCVGSCLGSRPRLAATRRAGGPEGERLLACPGEGEVAVAPRDVESKKLLIVINKLG